MIAAEIEKRAHSEIGVRFPAVVHVGEQVHDLQGRVIGSVRSVDGDLVKISISDPLAAKLVEEGALNAVALLDGKLTLIDNPMLIKSGGTIWKVARKMSSQSISDQLQSVLTALERLAKRTGGPRVPDRRASAGPLRSTRHGSPEGIAQALGLADDEAARERLSHMLIAASGASRPRNARPVGYSAGALAKFAALAEQVPPEDQPEAAAQIIRDIVWANPMRRY